MRAVFGIGALAAAALALAQAPPPRAIAVTAKCTTCDDVVRCVRASVAPARPGAVVVYHLQPMSFWRQIGTIGSYFLDLFRERTEERRDLRIFELAGDGVGTERVEEGREARLDLARSRLELPGAWIDQRSGAWFRADGTALGRCELLPRAEGLALLRKLDAAAAR